MAASLLASGIGSAVLCAPTASAGGADATIADLQAQGYLVQINWINGYDTKPLSQCTVTGINDPDHSGAPMQVGDTVYVDVRCPNHWDDGGGFTGGIGIGLG
ncbi:MAG: hypothetical protein JHC55_00580 [Mycolicibacterium sp.]|nr:hypothetical protein [Mycolicibacterium sp.]